MIRYHVMACACLVAVLAAPQLASAGLQPGTQPQAIFNGISSFGRALQGAASTQAGQASGRAMELYNEIMRARASRSLPSIPMCGHLNKVAELHVNDLQANNPRGRCNMHSWSQSSRWSGCCYTSNPSQSEMKCMWDKPRELSGYRGAGFEISVGAQGARVSPRDAVQSWMGSSAHRDVMMNAGMWRQRWGAVGVGISDSYAVAWFGHEAC